MKKKPNRRQRKSSSPQTLRGRIYKAQDQGAKAILGNPELMAQLLRDYIPLPGLKEIKAEDIEDVSERFIPLNQEGRDSDIIKRVHLAGQPIFIISLLEYTSASHHLL